MVIHLFFQIFDSEIKDLPSAVVGKVSQLPDLLNESRASNTVSNYRTGFLRWKKWALSNGFAERDVLPARAFHVALYLVSIIQQSNSCSPLINAFYSIKWIHSLYDKVSPTDSNLVKNVLEAAKRRLAKRVSKKESISVELLTSMYNSLYSEGNVYNQRTICACLIAYSGFLRSSELLAIKRSDIIIDNTHMSIFFEHSKTDIFRDGAWVLISRTNSELCPVMNTERYLKWASIQDDSDKFIFRNLTKCISGYILRTENKALSYTRLRELFMEAFKPHVSDISRYGLHGLRAGGASAAANHRVPDRLFKRHGRWRSENAKDGYVRDELNERLKVSQSLGL